MVSSEEKKIIKKVAQEMKEEYYTASGVTVLSTTVKFDEEHDVVEFIFVKDFGIDRWVFDYFLESCVKYAYVADTCNKQSSDSTFEDFNIRVESQKTL